MALRWITCPETAHLEEIEYEDTSLGMLLSACSRYRPCVVECARTCAARLDRRAHAEGKLQTRARPMPQLIEVRSLMRR
jgi:hypothetical protein